MLKDSDRITLNELGNDGKTVYLYYDEMVGLYLAFGLSAYYITMVMDPFLSYSVEMQMPVVLLKRSQILFLRQSLRKIEHRAKDFYQFELRSTIGEFGYSKWAQGVREKHAHI